jgi:DNA-binding GntR family transcriptional regulator
MRSALREHIVAALRRDIVAGRMSPRQPVVERQLAERFGVSHAPVREALLVLSLEGFIQLHPHRGARVASPAAAALRKLFIPIRQALEAHALKSCFTTLNQTDFAHWDGLMDRMRRAAHEGDHATLAEVDFLLHGALVDLVHEPHLSSVWRSVAGPIRFDEQQLVERHADPMQLHDQHMAIVQYCMSRQLEAALRALNANIGAELALV